MPEAGVLFNSGCGTDLVRPTLATRSAGVGFFRGCLTGCFCGMKIGATLCQDLGIAELLAVASLKNEVI